MVSTTMAGVLLGPPVTPVVCAWTKLRHHGLVADISCAWNGCGLKRLTVQRLAGFTITMSGTSPRKLLGFTQHHSDEGHTQGCSQTPPTPTETHAAFLYAQCPAPIYVA